MEGKSMRKNTSSPLIRVRSKVNNVIYYTSKDFPSKIIDGNDFIGVKKSEKDKQIFFMKKDSMELISNE
jgi:hypothetical protein